MSDDARRGLTISKHLLLLGLAERMKDGRRAAALRCVDLLVGLHNESYHYSAGPVSAAAGADIAGGGCAVMAAPNVAYNKKNENE